MKSRSRCRCAVAVFVRWVASSLHLCCCASRQLLQQAAWWWSSLTSSVAARAAHALLLLGCPLLSTGTRIRPELGSAPRGNLMRPSDSRQPGVMTPGASRVPCDAGQPRRAVPCRAASHRALWRATRSGRSARQWLRSSVSTPPWCELVFFSVASSPTHWSESEHCARGRTGTRALGGGESNRHPQVIRSVRELLLKGIYLFSVCRDLEQLCSLRKKVDLDFLFILFGWWMLTRRWIESPRRNLEENVCVMWRTAGDGKHLCDLWHRGNTCSCCGERRYLNTTLTFYNRFTKRCPQIISLSPFTLHFILCVCEVDMRALTDTSSQIIVL